MKIPIISDIHSNLEALEAVVEDILKKTDIDIKNTVCNGDIVGYGANPNECIDLLKKYNINSVIRGNHDEAANIVVMRKKDKNCDLSYVNKFNDSAKEAIFWTYTYLNDESKEYIAKLPTVLSKKDALFVHGSPRNPIDEYVFEHHLEDYFDDLFDGIQEKIIVMGHTHMPYVKYVNDKLLINPGSIGQPRDKDSRASYCILDLDAKTAEIIRVPYNVDLAAEKIKKAGLPEKLATRLFEGR